MTLNESIVEDAALEWFRRRQGYAGQVGNAPTPRLRRTGLGYAVGHGPHLAPDEPADELENKK